MKQIPILFSTPMVQAILEGRKTQTRRLLKCERIPSEDIASVHPDGAGKGWIAWAGRAVSAEETRIVYPGDQGFKCPYGAPGDVLWVRENWQLKGWDFEEGTMTIKYVTGETYNCLAHDPDEDSSWLMDKVDLLEKRGYIKPDPANDEIFVFTDKKQPFAPSIHMPKSAARIWLQVTDVKVERLQDITEDDAIAEGVSPKWCNSLNECLYENCINVCAHADLYANYLAPGFSDYLVKGAKESYKTLWQSINGAESWDANPWVWVISFKVLSTTGKPLRNVI